jgi:hypothetical protein
MAHGTAHLYGLRIEQMADGKEHLPQKRLLPNVGEIGRAHV